MKREIPQKVDAQFGFTDQSSSECAFRSDATLFRRTRSASFLSVTLTVGALGVLIPHHKAAAASGFSSDLSDSTTSQSGLVQSKRLGLSNNFNNPALSKVTLPDPDSNASATSLSSIKLESGIDWSVPQVPTNHTEAGFSTTSGLSDFTHSLNVGLTEQSLATSTSPDSTVAQPQIINSLTAPSSSASGLGQVLSYSGTIPPTQTSDQDRFHRVVPGENLTEIAEKYQVSPELIAKVNGIQDPNIIEADAGLTIPSTALTLSAPTNPLVLGALATTGADLNPPVQIDNWGDSATALKSRPEARPNIDLSETMLPPWTSIPTRQARVGSTMENLVKPAFQPLAQPKGEPIALLLKANANASVQQPAVPGFGAGVSPLVARRSVFPHIPVLDLPPLASADQFLPSAAMNGSNGSQNYIWPARGVLSSGYGWRWGRMHRGIDIAAPVGTPIVAAASGVVVSAGWNDGGYGYLVKVRHPDQSVTLYAHNSSITTRVGAVVNQGEMIAQMGSTGRSTGTHCHFEIRPSGQGATDPMAFLRTSQLMALN